MSNTVFKPYEGTHDDKLEAINLFLKAWDSLPIGDHQPSTVNNWLNHASMKAGIRALRKYQYNE